MHYRHRGLRALSCALAMALGVLAPLSQAAADEQADEVEELVLDYLKTGGKDPMDDQKLAEAGIDLAIGITSLGLTSLGIPGADAALGSLKKMFFGGADAIPAAVEKRFAKLEANLLAVTKDLGAVQDNVNKLNQGLANNSNGDRIDNLAPLKREILVASRKVTEVPGMGKPARDNYVGEALGIADDFLMTSPIGAKMWSWDNIRVQANLQTTKKPLLTIETAPDMNTALEPYLYAIGALAGAIDATGVRPAEAVLKPHYDLLDTLMEWTDETSCSRTAGPRMLANGKCSLTLRCTSPLATRTRTLEYAPRQDPNYGPQCGPYDSNDWGSTWEAIHQEIGIANLKVFDVINSAKGALTMAGKTQMMLAKSVDMELDALYSIDGEGRLYKYMHFMEERGGPNCTGPNASRDIRCSPDIVSKKPKCGPGVPSAGCQGDIAKAAPPPPEYNHQLLRPELQGGEWSRFSTVIVSQWLGQDLIVYGIDANGALIWRKVQNVLNGEAPTVVEAARQIGIGWNSLKNVFSTGQGVVYGVAANGDLVWYNHVNNYDGNLFPEWKQRTVGTGWSEFTRLFSPGEGVIYAVKPDGALMWYKHNGYLTGAGLETPGSWEEPKQIGNGWHNFKHLFAGPEGNIYAVNAAGELLFYKNLGWRAGAADWLGPVKIGDGWGDVTIAFAAMGGKPGARDPK